ncbi:TetR/AcrR family transcriptional regulator [Streptacidiphilus sp. EB103A]|uniref:TetR/AcrR family transcriptional regulator n=1 Tax=Streptacidiphilus sp. EB103A TaxID=3156275 RepID=UPI003519B6E7
MATATEQPQRRLPHLRADAVRNRERIVAAARELLVEHGTELPLDEVARRAGVGNATLYRHFKNRGELMHHVVLTVTDHVTDHAEQALAAEEAGETTAFGALRSFVHAAADERIGALCPMLDPPFDEGHPEVPAASDRLTDAIAQLTDRARASGELRADVSVGELTVALSQLTRPLPGSDCPEFDRFVHRHLQVFLDGLMTPVHSQLPGEAATWEDLRRN